MSAKEAYKAYIRAYASHSMKGVYDVNTLDVQQVAKSFGFRVAPFIDLGVSAGKRFNDKNSNGKRKLPFQSDKNAKKAKIFKNVSRTN